MKRIGYLFAQALALAIAIPSIASAQTAPAPDNLNSEAATFNVEYRAPAEKTVRVRLAPGLDIDPQLEPILAKCGFAYGPYSLTKPLYERAARKAANGKDDWGPCGRELIARVDDYTGQESTIGTVVSDVPGGYENCVLRKITNRGNNRDRCTFHARSAADIGLGQYTDIDRSTGGDTAVGDAALAMGIGVVNNLSGAAANHGFSKLFGTTCSSSGGGCGKGSVFNVSASASGGEGGDAYAEGGKAQAGAQSSLTLNQTGTGGACGSGTCPNPTNPSHTQNGPQGP